jgi:hypothetical protein
LTKLLDNSQRKQEAQAGDVRNRFSSGQMLHRLIAALPEPRDSFWQAITECVSANPKSARYILTQMAFYLHLGPFSREKSKKLMLECLVSKRWPARLRACL